MFDELRRAWREAVANFHQELRAEGGDPDGAHERVLRRELATAKGALAQLDAAIRDAQRQHAAERDAVADCRRREELARRIDDEETVRVAVEYAARHAERAAVLARKVEVLRAERTLLARDVTRMQELIGPLAGAVGGGAPAPGAAARGAAGRVDPRTDRARDAERTDADFEQLRRQQRERAAADRLDELKRRMGD